MINSIMNLEQFKNVAPSVFATEPSPKVSSRYIFVPTIEIVENLQKEGWEISGVKQSGKSVYGLHEIKFRNGGLPNVGDTLAEIIIKNSHNGGSTLNITAGLHRLCCSNGLTVPTSVSDSFRVRHSGFEFEDVKRLTEDFSKRLPIIQGSVNRMMEHQLTMDDKLKFAKKSAEVRWGIGSVPVTLNYDSILNPLRDEDKGDSLWQVFNVVQEKFIRGGVEYTTNSGRKTGLRTMNDIYNVNRINTKLWELAEDMM